MRYIVAFALAIAVSAGYSQTKTPHQKLKGEKPVVVDACPSKPNFDKIKTTPSTEKTRGDTKGGDSKGGGTQEQLHTLTEAEYQHLLEAVQTLAQFNARQWAIIDENQGNRRSFHGGFDRQIVSTNETTGMIESTEVYNDGYMYVNKPVPRRPSQRIDINSPQSKDMLKRYKAVTAQLEEASKTNATLKAKVKARKRIQARMERVSTTNEVFITTKTVPMGSRKSPAKKEEK